MSRWSIPCCCVLLGLITSPVCGQDRDHVQRAIQQGVQFLKRQQQSDGSWPYGGHEVGITALVGLALIENGVSLEDRALRKAYELVLEQAPQTTQTYDISLAILFLARVGDADDRPLIRQLGERLVNGQLSSGGWTYFCPLVAPPPSASVTNRPRGKTEPSRRSGQLRSQSGRGAGYGDNSNTQFAVLGIWTAGRAGLDVSAAMADVSQRFRTSQTSQGGWGYSQGGRADSDSMTCAGLMALVLSKGHKTLEGQMVNRRPDKEDQPDARSQMASDRQIDAGIRRVEYYAGSISAASSLYFLWSVERVGVALGSPRIGQVDWYSRGATVLLQTQNPDGSWMGGNAPGNHSPVSSTSFALLFLRRSNLTQGMPQLVTGRSEPPDENRMRAGSLEELLRSSMRDPKTPQGKSTKPAQPVTD